jgi:hypothetical protein
MRQRCICTLSTLLISLCGLHSTDYSPFSLFINGLLPFRWLFLVVIELLAQCMARLPLFCYSSVDKDSLCPVAVPFFAGSRDKRKGIMGFPTHLFPLRGRNSQRQTANKNNKLTNGIAN